MSLLQDQLKRIVQGKESNPFSILGPHQEIRNGQSMFVIRAFLPCATSATVVWDTPNGSPLPMRRIHPQGVYEAISANDHVKMPYRIRIKDNRGNVFHRHDPYAFPLCLSEYDLYLFGEGTLYQAYDKLGARVCSSQGISGVDFAVWAPNAVRVGVVGNFNEWDGRMHPMQNRGSTGIWELFIPDLGEGELYKFEILPPGETGPILKADPFAKAAELRPKTASVVCDLTRYAWGDKAWMEARSTRDCLTQPLSIYEVHMGSWKRVIDQDARWLTYQEMAVELVPYVNEMGFTHVELLPVTEHPFDGSWGYQCTGYFAPTSRYGPPTDFMALVDAFHQAGIGVIMDWAPAHFPDDPHGLALFDGTHLYDHEDPRLGYHPEWKSRIFNFSRTEVKNFLINSALMWLNHYHIDGLRVDAVASMLYLDYGRQDGEWIPNRFGGHENLEAVEFLKELNVKAHQEYPGVMMIAEESTAWPGVSRPTNEGGLGFTLKWNMGWMHDTLEYFSLDPIHRKYHHDQLTFSLVYAFTENFVLVLSHDEVVYGKKSLLEKMPGDEWQRFAQLRVLFGYLFSHPGKKMLFMGGEFGQWREWNHDHSLQWDLLAYEGHRGIQRWMADLNRLYTSQPALYQVDFDWTGFQWIDLHDNEQSILSYIRWDKDRSDFVVCLCNFTPVPRPNYRVGVPRDGWYRERLNSDAERYGGSNTVNRNDVHADEQPWQGQPYSMVVVLPPLAVVFFQPNI